MSYEGTEWAWSIRGLNGGERGVLDYICHRQDQRTNIARVSVPEIALKVGRTERQVTNILRRLESERANYPSGIIKRVHGGNGRGRVALYALVGFEWRRKTEIPAVQRVKFPAQKGEVSAEKDEIIDTLIRNEGTSEELPEEKQHHHSSTALKQAIKDWLVIKKQLQARLPENEYDLWARPMYLAACSDHGTASSKKCMRLALPPNNRIIRAAIAREQLLGDLAEKAGYEVSVGKYPDQYELERVRGIMGDEHFERTFPQSVLKKRAQGTGSRNG